MKVDPLAPTETDNVKSWSTIYPNYIDSTKTIAEGRKLPKGKCVDTPTAREIFSVCRHLQIKTVLEPEKKYSRDPWVEGRVKVLFRTHTDAEKKTFSSETNFKSKRELYAEIATLIPKMDNRIKAATQQKEKEDAEARQKEKDAKAASVKKTSGGGKKRGGGKRR
jgi:signal recognition particle subunit SRP19